jgi:predicted AAA+ superfamily ATPase
MEKIRGFLDQPELVKILTGLRRSGKSVMLDLIRQELTDNGVPPENMISLNFEDMSLEELKNPQKLHDYLKEKMTAMSGRAYLFLDELQEVENWETCINSLRVNSDADIYVTGSNSKMLAGEFATMLSGRYVQIEVYPFSFQEFCMAMREKKPKESGSELFRQYLKQGGMPFVVNVRVCVLCPAAMAMAISVVNLTVRYGCLRSISYVPMSHLLAQKVSKHKIFWLVHIFNCNPFQRGI